MKVKKPRTSSKEEDAATGYSLRAELWALHRMELLFTSI
jgi:hypothetical protein